MANNTIDIDVIINTAKSAKSLKEQRSALDSLREGLDNVKEGSSAFDQLTAASNELVGSMDTLSLTFEDVYGDVKPLSTQMGEMEDRMYAMANAGKTNTKEFKTLQDEVIRLKTVVRETDDTIDAFSQRGAKLNAFVGVASGIAGGFALAQGAAALFGKENENVEKALLKVQGAIAVLTGLQEIQKLVTEKNIIVQRIMNAVMKANPIFIMLGVVTAVTTAWLFFTRSQEKVKKTTEETNAELKKQSELFELINQKADLYYKTLNSGSSTLGNDLEVLEATGIEYDKLYEAQNKIIQIRKEELVILAQRRAFEQVDSIQRLKVNKGELTLKNQFSKEEWEEYKSLIQRKKVLDANYIRTKQEHEAEITQNIQEEIQNRLDLQKEFYKTIESLDNQHVLDSIKDDQEILASTLNGYNKQLVLLNQNNTNIGIALSIAKVNELEIIQKSYDDGLISTKEYNDENEKILSTYDDKQLKQTIKHGIDIKKLNTEINESTTNAYATQLTHQLNEQISIGKLMRQHELNNASKEIKDLDELETKKASINLRWDKLELTQLEEINANKLIILTNTFNQETRLINETLEYLEYKTQQSIELSEAELLIYENSIAKKTELSAEFEVNRVKLHESQIAASIRIANLEESVDKSALERFQEAYNKREEVILTYVEVVQTSIDAIQELEDRKTERALENIETERNAKLNALDEERSLKTALNSDDQQAALQQLAQQRTLTEERQAIEDEYNQKARNEKRKQFQKQKRADLIQSIINGALGVTKALASSPPPLNFILAAGVGVASGIQSGLIASQPVPTFARGGILKGASHINGGISTPFGELEGDEAVINKKSTKLFGPMLSAINVAGGGKSFDNSSPTSVFPVSSSNNDLTEIKNALKKFSNTPIQTYVNESEITKSQNNVKRLQKRNTF
jgi:hypothetical protein